MGHANASLKQRKENTRNPLGAQFAIGKKRLGFCQLCSPCCKLSLRRKKCFGVFIFFYITSNKYQGWADNVHVKSAGDFGLYCEQNR